MPSKHKGMTIQQKDLTKRHKDLTSQHYYLKSYSRNMPPYNTFTVTLNIKCSIIQVKHQYCKNIHSKQKIYVVACIDGTFGIDCLHNCSSHCLNDSLCEKDTGYCDMGCNPGYTSKNCTEGMYTSLMYISQRWVLNDI